MAIVAEKLIGARARNLFLIIMFFLIWMVIAVFALVIANLFVSFPSSVIPVNFEIIVALLMGYFINKKGAALKLPSIMAQLALFVMIYLAISLVIWVEYFRLVRAIALNQVASPALQSSMLMGFGKFYLFRRHIWPALKADVFSLAAFGASTSVAGSRSVG